MTRHIFTVMLSTATVLCSLSFACTGNSTNTTETPVSSQAGVQPVELDTIPGELDSAKVAFRQTNVFTSGDMFCVVSLVDNLTDDWRKIWLKAEILDAKGNVLTVDGSSSLTLRTFSDAVPPRGATSFFLSIPYNQISGVPADCRLSGAGSIRRPAGPILFASGYGGVRAMYADKADPTKVVEKEYQLQATLENPLDMVAYHPKMVLLVYGRDDQKLYFAQLVDPENPNTIFTQEREGPLQPGEKRKITCRIYYEMLPQQIKDQLIGRVEMQLFEAR
ncbi:MAG: hypothetical protein EP344_07915 [Bacteroidetes bacterium]|nr:MAG: hypothetical protein EP344_07915 [Bacteroidota bacterium]